MTASELSALTGIVMSLGLAYLPWVKDLYNQQDGRYKAFGVLVGLAVVSIVIYVLGCLDFISSGVTCDQAGALQLAKVFIAALMANQSTFLVAVKPFQPKDEEHKDSG